jgi:hypothetical protein
MASTTLPPEQRKKILRVLFVSLLLDLVRPSDLALVTLLTKLHVTDIFHLHPASLPLLIDILPLP